ncbi:unnamed protein product [Rotaria sp. Silwood2]|nr:unnamed protein product [Rotaria sp. Silwood2]
MSLSFIDYLSIIEDEQTGEIILNEDRIDHILTEYRDLYAQSNPDLTETQRKEETLNKLANKLDLLNSRKNMEYLDICIKEETLADAKLEVINKFLGSVEYLDYNTVVTEQQNHVEDDRVANAPVEKPELKQTVDDFMENFLFRQIQDENGQAIKVKTTKPLADNAVHILPKGTILDLFIRQQLTERGNITFKRTRTKFRLVEPVSLTDEFDSWTFDNFQQIFDFWLTVDPHNNQQKTFPTRWKLDPRAVINYIIGTVSDETGTRIQRPSTKSLENFIRDVCTIEDNGMAEEWFEALTTDEDILTYAHLSNLTMPEWEKIRKLPMNALKTIKFYIDQEKNLTAARKVSTIKEKKKDNQLTYSELLAKLHMIKLFLIHQLNGENGIEEIPHLEGKCVEQAFIEMHTEGYEDDGLFDDMKLFFQPLTITDEELKINQNELINANKQEQNEIKKLEQEIQDLNEKYNQVNQQLQDLVQKMMKKKAERDELFERHETAMKENMSYQERTRRNLEWCRKTSEMKKEIDTFKKQITEKENELKDIETPQMEKDNRRDTIKALLAKQQTKIDRSLIQLHRGFIMYGPPGTGKSHLMSKLSSKIGIAMLAPPLASGNLERSLVGQSEAVISSLCRRAKRLPHLICCLSIDEIDSLAPRRDEKSSEGKVSKISVLLSVLEGAENVPNLMFFSATNLLHRMDEAFLRRMSGKFFVGRPSSESRKKLLGKLPKTMFKPMVLEKLATATTNFSGSALTRLNSEITTHHRCQRRDNPNYEVTEEDALILADRTARHYQLYLGLDTLPRLQLRNLYDRKKLSQVRGQSNKEDNDSEAFHLPKKCTFTGKIVISLSERQVRIECIDEFNQRYIIEDKFRETEQNLQQLLERITAYGTDRNVQLLQLIDLNLLSSKGAYDEQKVSEILKECYDECTAYKRSMIVYDLDSLIGVNKSESDSSMGTSVSSSIINQHIYVYVTNRFQEAKIENSNPDVKARTERWAVAIVRDMFLLKKFTSEVDFTPTDAQQDKEEEDERKSTQVIACVKCGESYIENENKLGICTHHDGFVYDNAREDLKKYRLSEAIELLNLEEYKAMNANQKEKEEFERKKTRMKFICCGAVVQTGGNNGGCKKLKHGFDHPNQRRTNRHALLEEDIKLWEDACFENIFYNDQRVKLIEKRQLNQ